jgi:aspartyl-tRNA(Asn)/glutamyl-tRNA(Gln) amidotransferase subunit A
MELSELPAHALRRILQKRDISPRDVLSSAVRSIEAREKDINAYITLDIEEATARACELEESFSEPLPPLYGIPLAVKDNLCTKDLETTCASKILLGYKPPYTATAVGRAIEAGAILIGKTNMDEFAMGSTGEFSYFGAVRNPKDPERVAGGSSSGSAAAVAAFMGTLGLGSDTGGSVRLPSSYCGVVGLKPTYGRVSRYGLVAFASSLDGIGTFARDVEDTAVLYSVIAGFDRLDSTSMDVPLEPAETMFVDYERDRPRIGLPTEYFAQGLEPEIERAVRNAASNLEKEGFTVREISLPHTDHVVAVYQLLCTSEASSNLARYDGMRYGYRTREFDGISELNEMTRAQGFGSEVKRRILLGTFALSEGYYEAYYLKAQKARRRIKEDFERTFSEVDVLLAPVSPIHPPKLGEKIEDPLSIYLLDVLTAGANLAGVPAVSLRCGESKDGLPIGLQLIGRPFEERRILRTARFLEDLLS